MPDNLQLQSFFTHFTSRKLVGADKYLRLKQAYPCIDSNHFLSEETDKGYDIYVIN